MYKVAIVSITLNAAYWPYLGPMVESAKKFLLKGHQVDFYSWSDIDFNNQFSQKIVNSWAERGVDVNRPDIRKLLTENIQSTLALKDTITIIPQEPAEWPLPTLCRFHLFLKEEKRLADYDFVFYVDTDMLFVSPVGDEILGDLVVAQHPMHALKRGLINPSEPNPESQSFIPKLGRIITKNGKKMFEPIYPAGGFQGGRSDKFIEAMKVMKEMIDKDFSNNYVSIWNDQSIWEAYLFKLTPTGILPDWVTILSPSYVYPDSLIRSYYIPVWGKNYLPKIITLTKPFTTSKEAGIQLQTKI